MPNSKIVYDGETLIDLTSDTVSEETLEEGVTATAANGEKIVGKGLPGRVRYDVAQSLTDNEKEQARENLGVSSGVYYGTEEPTEEPHPVWIDPTGDPVVIPTKTSELTNDSGFLTSDIIGATYKGAWIAEETDGTASQVYTETISVPAGTYLVTVVTPFAGVVDGTAGTDILINFSAGLLVGTGVTYIKSQYSSVTLPAKFTTQTNLLAKSAASKNSATWSYLERGGICAVRIA